MRNPRPLPIVATKGPRSASMTGICLERVMAIILSGNITVDESGNLQNANATPDIPEDSNDNDITVAAINDNDDTGDLP